jgi:dynein heavy chain
MIEVTQRVSDHFKPTPNKCHYNYGWRDSFKIFNSLQMIEGNSLKSQANVIKLIYHECLRTFGDRILIEKDRDWFLKSLEEVCRANFECYTDEDLSSMAPEQINIEAEGPCRWPVTDPKTLFFSHWNLEAEGFYMEVERVEDIQRVIEGNLVRFNDSNERTRLDLLLYNQINIQMLKMQRIISSPKGHILNIAMKGMGMNSIVRLVTFAAGH